MPLLPLVDGAVEHEADAVIVAPGPVEIVIVEKGDTREHRRARQAKVGVSQRPLLDGCIRIAGMRLQGRRFLHLELGLGKALALHPLLLPLRVVRLDHDDECRVISKAAAICRAERRPEIEEEIDVLLCARRRRPRARLRASVCVAVECDGQPVVLARVIVAVVFVVSHHAEKRRLLLAITPRARDWHVGPAVGTLPAEASQVADDLRPDGVLVLVSPRRAVHHLLHLWHLLIPATIRPRLGLARRLDDVELEGRVVDPLAAVILPQRHLPCRPLLRQPELKLEEGIDRGHVVCQRILDGLPARVRRDVELQSDDILVRERVVSIVRV